MIVVAGVVRSPYIFVLLKTCLYEAATGELCLDGGLVVGVCVCVDSCSSFANLEWSCPLDGRVVYLPDPALHTQEGSMTKYLCFPFDTVGLRKFRLEIASN